MSVQAVNYVLRNNRTAKGVVRCVLLVLADYARPDGTMGVPPSLATIAEEAVCNRSYANEACLELEAAGDIERAGVTGRGVIIWTVRVSRTVRSLDRPGEPDAVGPEHTGEPDAHPAQRPGEPDATIRVSQTVRSPDRTDLSRGYGSEKLKTPPNPPTGGTQPPPPPTSNRKRDLERHRHQVEQWVHANLSVREEGDGALMEEIHDQLRRRVPEQLFEVWLADLDLIGRIGPELAFSAPAELVSTLNDRFAEVLALSAGQPVRVVSREIGAPAPARRPDAGAGTIYGRPPKEST